MVNLTCILAKLSEKLKILFFKFKPDLVYIPHSNDGHKDHKATFFILEAALKELKKVHEYKIPLVLCYEVWTPLDQISQKVDIKPVMDTKLEALAEHKTQHFITRLVKSGKTMRCGNNTECFEKLVI